MLWPGSAPCNELYQVVFWSIRLPMTLTALVVGASSALAGLLMQTVLATPRQPVYAGISAAAGFGAALSIITGFSRVARWHWARRCWLR